jgi:hypothetical protein
MQKPGLLSLQNNSTSGLCGKYSNSTDWFAAGYPPPFLPKYLSFFGVAATLHDR